MSKQPKWCLEEAVLLLNTLLQVNCGIFSRDDAIRLLSCFLRDRAVKKGLDIDSIYRNTTGIKLRMLEIEYEFTAGKHGIKKIVHAYSKKLFICIKRTGLDLILL